MQKDTETSIIESLDGSDRALYFYLDYLLQDLREIGSSPDAVLQLITNHNPDQNRNWKVLDLGCGKGAVSVPIARQFGWQVVGLDAYPPFIRDANRYAKEQGVDTLCRYDVADIRQEILKLEDFNLVILGSIGPVLGDIESTLNQVKTCIAPDGCILLDDGCLPDEYTGDLNLEYPKKSEAMRMIKQSGMRMIEEWIHSTEYMEESNTSIFDRIKQRAEELGRKYPEQKPLFDNYVRMQAEENQVLENDLVCAMWLLKKSV